MKLEIITPVQKVYEGEIEAVKVPGVNGSFEVLQNHAPIISALAKGEVRITSAKSKPEFYTIDSGVIEVLNNQVIILTESAVQA